MNCNQHVERILIFKNEMFGEIHVKKINGEPLFLARTIIDMLGDKNFKNNFFSIIDKSYIHVSEICPSSGIKDSIFLNQEGLQILIDYYCHSIEQYTKLLMALTEFMNKSTEARKKTMIYFIFSGDANDEINKVIEQTIEEFKNAILLTGVSENLGIDIEKLINWIQFVLDEVREV